jgi:hypothetical protein
MRMLVLSRKDLSSPAPATCDDGLLGKPFTESELLTAVRRSLAQPAPRSQRRRGGARATIKPIKCRGHANEGGTSCEMQTGKQ